MSSDCIGLTKPVRALRRCASVCALGAGLLLAPVLASAQTGDEPPPSPPLNRAPAQKPLNETATTAAWKALQAGRYQEAITNADGCINRFRSAAEKIQALLETKGEPLPTGEGSPAEKELIARNGLLNDVAACLFIKGSASEKLGRPSEAVALYKAAQRFTYARVCDPEAGGLWAPSQAAAERLAALAKPGGK